MPRRRNPLVCQYIENLSSAALEAYADIVREIVGRRHGVYALYRRDKLYYVGLATDLRNRLNAHLKDRHKGLWDRFSVYLTIDHTHLKELESLVIRIAQPKGNKQLGKFARSENLTRTLRQRLRAKQRAEWLRLIGKVVPFEDEEPRAKRRRKTKGRTSRAAGLVTKAVVLRGNDKSKLHKARLRKDGTVRYAGNVYESPSKAGAAARGRPTNGWWFWHYERAPGQWVRLRELRSR